MAMAAARMIAIAAAATARARRWPGRTGESACREGDSRTGAEEMASFNSQLPRPVPLFGRSEAHCWKADWNCGELALTPEGTLRAPLPVGSGKLGTPCVCMQ